MYESDITRFLREIKSVDPAIEEDQRRGRAIWWDRAQDLETAKRNRESRVPPTAYAYYAVKPEREPGR